MNERENRFAEQVRQRLEEAGALWIYDGDPRRDAPHALLTSGLHSNGFANVGQILKEQPGVRRKFAEYIVDIATSLECGKFHRVVGADTSSTDLAKEVALLLGILPIVMVKTEDEYGKKGQAWHPENLPLREGEIILHLEELITTASSAKQVRKGIRRAMLKEPVFASILPAIVERSDPDNRIVQLEDSVIVPLLRLDIRNFPPGENSCPYCAAGSEAIRPKHEDNWFRLTGK